jgi:hypothetical protein
MQIFADTAFFQEARVKQKRAQKNEIIASHKGKLDLIITIKRTGSPE